MKHKIKKYTAQPQYSKAMHDAIQDIMHECTLENKCFIMYNTHRTKVINYIIDTILIAYDV